MYLVPRFATVAYLIEYDLFLWYQHLLLSSSLLEILRHTHLLLLHTLSHLNDLILENLIGRGLQPSEAIRGISDALIDLVDAQLLLAQVRVKRGQERSRLVD